MSLFQEMKTVLHLTDREQDIRNYLLNNPEQIFKMSSRELGEATFTSAASVTRFCQKLGCKGYPDFKMRFISELKSEKLGQNQEKIAFSERENLVTIVQKVTEIQRKSLEETEKELSLMQLMRIRAMLHQAEYVDFYAYDINIHSAEYGCSQLFHAGKIAHVYSETNLQGLHALMQLKNHLAILISHTGENTRLVEIAKLLRQNHTKTIIITTGKERTLAKLGDEFLYAYSSVCMDEFGTASFASSVKYILDLIFAMEFSCHYAENMKLNEDYEKIGRDTFWSLIQDV